MKTAQRPTRRCRVISFGIQIVGAAKPGAEPDRRLMPLRPPKSREWKRRRTNRSLEPATSEYPRRCTRSQTPKTKPRRSKCRPHVAARRPERDWPPALAPNKESRPPRTHCRAVWDNDSAPTKTPEMAPATEPRNMIRREKSLARDRSDFGFH